MNTSTNSVPVPSHVTQTVTQTANALGINVTEEQVGAIILVVGVASRWLKIELKVIRLGGGIKKMYLDFWHEFWGPKAIKQITTAVITSNENQTKNIGAPPVSTPQPVGNGQRNG